MTAPTRSETSRDRPARRARRSQPERSAATRAALLDATIECLAELGYARTSTTEIVRRAGVSRGAQVHHFPTKSQLVAAALEHLLQRRVSEFNARFAEMDPAERTPTAALDVLWSLVHGEAYRALIQFMVAALADDDLKPIVAVVVGEFERLVVDQYERLFPARSAEPFMASAVRFVVRSVETAALYRELGLEHEAAEMLLVLRKLSSLDMAQATALWEGTLRGPA